MGRSGSVKRARHIAALPDELMHIIFYELDFKSKICAGLACKQWDQLLKDGTAAARHWDIDYKVARIVALPDDDKTQSKESLDHPCSGVGRCAHPLLTTLIRRVWSACVEVPVGHKCCGGRR
jgi:hypothetical protein